MKKVVIYILTFFSSVFALLDTVVVIIQPGPEYAQDCMVVNNISGSGGSWGHHNNGKTPCMAAGAYDLNTICRSLLKFPIPSNINAQNIINAEIVLNSDHWENGDTISPCPVSIYQMLQSWKSGNGAGGCNDKELNSAIIDGATGIERFWDNQINLGKWNAPNVGMDDVDAKKLPEVTVTGNFPSTTPWFFNITELCKTWVKGTAPNYGVLIRNPLDHGINGKCLAYPIFCTGENTLSPEKRPLLRIVYHLDTEPKRLAFWPFDTISKDSIIIDKEGQFDIRCSNVKISISPSTGSALECTSDSFALEVKSSKDSLCTPDFTIECMVYYNQPSPAELPLSQQKVFSFENIDSSEIMQGYSLTILPNGKVGLYIAKPNRTWADCISFDSLSPQKWYHVVGTYDGTNLKVYVNGKLSNQVNSPGGYVYSKINAAVASQSMNGVVGHRLNGKLSQLSIYNFALSADSIQTQYSKYPLSKPTRLMWHFEDVIDSVNKKFADASGNNVSAQFTGTGIGLASGISGKALECKGTSFDIQIPDSQGIFNTPAFTIEGWVYSYVDLSDLSTFVKYKKIFEWVTSSADDVTPRIRAGYSIAISDFGSVVFSMSNEAGNGWNSIISDTILKARTWYHVVATYDKSTMKLYLNGKLINYKVNTSPYVRPTDNARIGCELDNTGTVWQQFDGKIDELAFYNYPLSSDSILKNYTSLKPKEEIPFKINFGMKTAYAKPGDTVCMPIILTNYENFSINSCQLDMHYDTTSVSLLEISNENTLIKDWALFNWNFRNNRKDSIIIAMGGTALPLHYGGGTLVNCYFIVKPNAAKGDSCIISLSNIDIDENREIVNPSNQNGKILIDKPSILYGDVTGNGEVTTLDAVKVLNYTVGTLHLPDSTAPNFTLPVADVSGNTKITSYDAALIFQYSLGLMPAFPVNKNTLSKKTIASMGKSATISIMPHNKGLAGAQYDIMGTNLKGCISVDMELACDSNYHFTDGDINSPIKSATTLMNLTNKKTILVGMSMPDNIDEDTALTVVRLTLPPTINQQLPLLRIVSISLNEGNIPVKIENPSLISSVFKNLPSTKPTISVINKTISISNLYSDGEFQLWSLNGKLVYKTSCTVNSKHSTFIKLNALRKGIYFYRFKSGTFSNKGSFIFTK